MAHPGMITVDWMEEVDSTNLLARRWIEDPARGTADRKGFAARRQSAGVGRHGRRWHSPEGGLWCSLAWGLESDAATVLDALGLRVGIACWRTVRAFAESGDVRLKWPNDVLIDGRKVCGCLVESFTHEGRMWLVVGVGINVANRAEELPAGLRTPPTSLNEHRGKPTTPVAVLPALIEHLSTAIEAGPAERAAWFAEAGTSLHGVGSAVVVDDGSAGGTGYVGVLAGLSSDGRLRVRRGPGGDEEVALALGTAIEYGQGLSGAMTDRQ